MGVGRVWEGCRKGVGRVWEGCGKGMGRGPKEKALREGLKSREFAQEKLLS